MAQKLLAAAKYQIIGLKQIYGDIIFSVKTFKNAIQTLIIGDKYDATKTVNKANEFIVLNI